MYCIYTLYSLTESSNRKYISTCHAIVYTKTNHSIQGSEIENTSHLLQGCQVKFLNNPENPENLKK